VGVICVKVYHVEIWEWCCLNGEVVNREYYDIEASDEEDLWNQIHEDLWNQIHEIIDSYVGEYPHEELADGSVLVYMGKDHAHQIGAYVLNN